MNAWDSEYQSGCAGTIYKPLWELARTELDKATRGIVVDYGCGDGRYSQLMGRVGFDVIGIDCSRSAIAIARNGMAVDELIHTQFLVGNDIPDTVADESVSAVVMLNSYHCMDRKARQTIVASTNRVLARKGILVMSVLT